MEARQSVAIIDRINRNRIATFLIATVAFAAGALIVQYLRSFPQLEANEEVLKTVDALFTALTSKNSQRLNDCDQKLKKFRDDGSVSSSAAKKLDAIIQRARAGEWEASSKTLYEFILGQRPRK